MGNLFIERLVSVKIIELKDHVYAPDHRLTGQDDKVALVLDQIQIQVLRNQAIGLKFKKSL